MKTPIRIHCLYCISNDYLNNWCIFSEIYIRFLNRGTVEIHASVSVYIHTPILVIYIYINVDKTNLYNLSVCGSIFIHGNLYSWAWDCPESVTRAWWTALDMSWPGVVHHLQSHRWSQQSCPLLPGLLLAAVRQHSGPWLFIATLRCCICQNVNSEMPVNELLTLFNGLKIAGFMLDASIPRSSIGFLGFS